MPHAHYTLCAQLIEDDAALLQIPANTSLEEILAAVAWNAKSQATQRKTLAAMTYLSQPQGANATEKRKHISTHLAQYFEKIAEDSNFRLLLRVFRITGEDPDAAAREDLALAALKAWTGSAPAQGEAFKPIEDLSPAIRADLAARLGLQPDVEAITGALTDLLGYMDQPEAPAAGAEAPAPDFWKHAALLLQPLAPAHEQEGAAGGAPDHPAPAAAAAGGAPDHHMPAAPASGGLEHEVLMSHKSGAPALAVTQTHPVSRMTTVLRKLSREGSISHTLMLQLVVAVADCNEPAGVGTYTATRDFLFDAAQRVGHGGAPLPTADKAAFIWSDHNMEVQGSGTDAVDAKTLLAAVCAPGSFNPDLQLAGGSAARCLIIDAQALSDVQAVGELHDMGHGCDRAICDLCQKLFSLVDNSSATRQLIRPGMDESYRLFSDAYHSHDRAVIRSGVEAVVSRARQLSSVTSKTRRDRLLIIPLLLIISREAVDSTIWLRVQNVARGRGVPEAAAANIVWQNWLATFVGSAELPLFFDKAAVADWVSLIPNHLAGAAEQQPLRPAAASASGPSSPTQRPGHPPSRGATRRSRVPQPAQPSGAQSASPRAPAAQSTAYSCAVCGMNNHHTVDCFKLQDGKTTEAELRARFHFHQFRIHQLGVARFVPLQSARDPPPPAVDDNWDEFARRAAGRRAPKRKRAE